MSRAEITSEINNLVKQGNMRDAYAKFEELPIIDQIGISLSPGVGDALAVYETGEFGKRAKERFSEGETLKGVGNLAISGLSAASLIPLFRWLRGARGGTKLATEATDLVKDVAPVKVDPVLQLSPPKPPKPKKVKVKPIPYDKFEPVNDISKLDYPGTMSHLPFRQREVKEGLVSGVRKAINEENLPNELTLEQWTKKLLGFGNVKKSELQALDFIDELGNPHPRAVNYFSDLLATTNRKPTAVINKKGIDNYLAERQTHLFDIRQAPDSQWPSGSKIADGVDHNQKVYRARDILSGEGRTGKETNAHFNPYYDNVAVFDHANNALTDDIARNLERLAGKFDPIDILSDIRMNPSFAGDEAAKLVKLSEKLNAEDIVPQQLENFKAGPDAELYSKFIKAHKKLGIPEKKEILDFVEELKALGADDISTQFKQIRRAQSDYAEDIAKGPGYFDMSRFEGRKFNWPSLSERGDDFLNVGDTVARRNSLVKKLMDFDEKTLKADAKTPRVTEQRYKIGKEIAEIDDALLTEAKDSAGDVFLDPNALDTFEVFPDATKRILKTLREDFLSRTPTQRRTLMMRRYDRMQELKDLPFDAKNKLARDVTLLQYMRTALDPRYVKAKKLYPDLLRPDKVVPRAKSVDLPGLDAPYKKDFFAEKGRPKVNSLVLRKNLLDAVAEGKKGIHIDYVQTIEEGGSADVVTAQYREMTKALRKVLQELKVKDEVLEVAVPSTGSFDPEIGKYAFAGRDDIGAGAYYKFTPEFLDAVKKLGINAFNKGGPVGIQESLNELNKAILPIDISSDVGSIKPVEESISVKDVTDIIFDPTDPVDYAILGAGPLGKFALSANKTRKLIDKVLSLKQRGRQAAAKELIDSDDLKLFKEFEVMPTKNRLGAYYDYAAAKFDNVLLKVPKDTPYAIRRNNLSTGKPYTAKEIDDIAYSKAGDSLSYLFKTLEEGGNSARKVMKQHPEVAALYKKSGREIPPAALRPDQLKEYIKGEAKGLNAGGPSDIQESLNELNNYTDAEREAIIKAKNEYEREAAYKKELADLDAYISDNRLVSKEAQMSSMSGEGYKDPRFTVSFDNPIINKFALHPFAGEGSGYQPNTKELGMEGPEELLESSVGGRYYPRTDVVMFKDPYRGITLDRLTELGIDAQKYKGHIKTKEDIQKHELLHRTAHKSGYLDFLPTSEFLKENSTTKYLKGSLAKFLTPLINEALAESYEDIDSGGLQKRIRFRASRFNGLKENKKQEIADEIFENIDVLKQDFENYLESQMNPDELNATQKNAGGLVSIDNMLAQL